MYYEFGAFRPVFKLSSDPYLSGIVQFYVLRIFKYISCLFFNLKNIFFVNPWPFMIDPLKHRVYLKKLCLFDPAVSTEIGYKHTNAHTENSYKKKKKKNLPITMIFSGLNWSLWIANCMTASAAFRSCSGKGDPTNRNSELNILPNSNIKFNLQR